MKDSTIRDLSLMHERKRGQVHMMGPVETLGIHTIDVPHAPGQVGVRGLSGEMVMIAEQAKSANPHIPQIHRFFQKVNKP